MTSRTLLFACGLFAALPAQAWENHRSITRASLQSYEGWETVSYEPLEAVLPKLSVEGKKPVSLKDLTELLNVHADKIQWDWNPDPAASKPANALDVLVQAVREPDDGMDQNLTLTPDQKYMGGFTGSSSQGVRHMYYRAWSFLRPLATFHFPMREMGFAPERAATYFELAQQAKAAGHLFWAYRFLGWGLHYVQDLGQPFHASQFASLKLLPLGVLFSVGWEPFVAETTRIVANYHLAFEQYIDSLLDPDRENALLYAFKVPKADEQMKIALEQGVEVKVLTGAQIVAEASNELAASVASDEKDFMGTYLAVPGLSLSDGFRDASGRPKIDFVAIDSLAKSKEPQKALLDSAVRALSNTGVATRWYVDRFRDVDTAK